MLFLDNKRSRGKLVELKLNYSPVLQKWWEKVHPFQKQTCATVWWAMQTRGITVQCVYAPSLFCFVLLYLHILLGNICHYTRISALTFPVLHSFIGDPSWQGTLDPHTGQGPVIKSSRICNDGAVSVSGCVYGTYMEGPQHVWLTCHYTSAQMPHGHRRTACTPCTCTQNETRGHYLQRQ